MSFLLNTGQTSGKERCAGARADLLMGLIFQESQDWPDSAHSAQRVVLPGVLRLGGSRVPSAMLLRKTLSPRPCRC